MSFFNKLKSAFGGKQKPPQYRQYTPSELKMIAMKTRLILEQHRQTLMQHITKQDQQFRYAGQDPKKVYDILQSIGQKVIEAESLKILIEMVRKIQGHTNQIITTHGDVSKLKGQIQWFQCVLWYRRSREITNLEDLFSFCYNFFKGADITTQLNVHCEVFQFYPIMKYLPKNGGFPLHELLPYIEPYVNHKIDPSVIDNVVGMSKMINSGMGPQHQSYIYPHQGPVNPPNPHKSYHYPQNNNVPPYVPPQQPNKPQSDVNPYQTDPYRQSSQNFSNNPYQNPQPINPNPYPNVPGYPNNSNIPGNQNQPNPNYSNIPLNPHYSNLPTPNQHNSNISRPNHQSYDPTYTPTDPNPHFSPYNPPQHSNTSSDNPYQTKSPQKQPQQQPKKTFYGSIMKGPTPNYDRQSFEREHNEQYGSQVPFNRDTPEEGFTDIDQTMKELEQIEKKQSQMQESKKREEERKAREMEEARKIREEQQARKRIEEELRLQEQQKRRKEEEQRRKQEEERLRKEEEQKLRREEEQKLQREEEQKLRREEEQRLREQAQRIDIERRQAERRVKEQEDEEQKLIDELKRQNQMEKQQQEDEDQALLREAEERFGLQDQEEEQNDKEKEHEIEQDAKSESSSEKEDREWEDKREQIERELDEREQQLEINVFEDNEREDLDRGMSGRFSNNFGMKVDFGDNDGQQFNYNSGRQIQTSMLRFNTNNSKEDDEPLNSVPSAPDRPQQDQAQSLDIIKKHAGCEPETTFKLFYFKRMELNQ